MTWTLVTMLTVHMHVTVDGSLPLSMHVAEAEAAAIWRVHGVDLAWENQPDAWPACVDAVIERRHWNADAFAPVLGRVVMNADHPGPIRIAFDAIDAMIPFAFNGPSAMHQFVVATAIGRVLAHELGHVLLGPPGYHDPEGLMRQTFLTNEFGLSDRPRFHLTARSLERLRAREPALQDGALACRERTRE